LATDYVVTATAPFSNPTKLGAGADAPSRAGPYFEAIDQKGRQPMIHTQIALRTDPLSWVDRAALRDVSPMLVGLAPFAMVLGVAMRDADISTPTGLIGSLVMYAGSAQLAAIALMKSGAGIVSIMVAVAMINARFVMYGAALEPRFRSQPAWFRWLAPHFLVDQSYILADSRSDLGNPQRFRRYWLTVAAAIGVVWLSAIGLTLTVGDLLPAETPLTFAPTVILVGILVPKLRYKKARQAAVAAVLTTLCGASLPSGGGLLLGVVVGAFAPTLMARRKP
jgi:predicted branched-subunit amino acid permease